ncbi:MAG: response regulator [Spirochaetales bacterium]|nr:response regulator [Spirochaetales bacterium]
MGITYFFIGIFVTLSVYHLLVFFGRRKDLSNLTFALFNLFYSFFIYWNSIYRVSDAYDYTVFHFIYAIASVLFAFDFVFFIQGVLGMNGLKRGMLKFIYSFMTLALINCFLFLFFNNIFFIRVTYTLLLLSMVLYLGNGVFDFISERKTKTRNQYIIFIGFIFLSIMIVAHTAGMILTLQSASPMALRFYFLLMIFTFSYAITDSFNQDHKALFLLKQNLEQKVIERTRQLQDEKKQKETLFLNIAHELKTPLTIVSSSFDQYYSSRPEEKELNRIKTGLDKLKRDIVNFLDINKLESGKPFYNHDMVLDIPEFIGETLEMFKSAVNKAGLALSCKLDVQEIFVRIDPLAMERILNNLIENAIKYNKPDGSIQIELLVNDDRVDLVVADTGIGISENDIANVLLPYFQIYREKRNIQGLGMGLAIVREICDDLSAEIKIESKENKGTRFIISFKRYFLKAGEKAAHHFSSQQAVIVSKNYSRNCLQDTIFDNSKPSVLLVEDNLDLLGLLKEKLSEQYNVFCAENGLKALEKLGKITSSTIDVIVSDIMMDSMDGETFRNKLLEDRNHHSIPFIFLTAKSSRETRLKCLANGAVDYIVKPFSQEELLHKISALIRMKASLQEDNLLEVERRVTKYLQKNAQFDVHQYKSGKEEKIYSIHGISDQEIRVIAMLKEGLLYKEIAANLNISLNTVRTYIRRIHKKFNIHSSKELQGMFDQASQSDI